jgi:hypothetical protein
VVNAGGSGTGIADTKAAIRGIKKASFMMAKRRVHSGVDRERYCRLEYEAQLDDRSGNARDEWPSVILVRIGSALGRSLSSW